MLEDLSIKDFAIIDSVRIEFSKGFTVLSGETGAGKSILIGAITFLLGGKSDVSQIRVGAEEATVCGTFLLDSLVVPNPALVWLEEHGIQPENNRVLVRRFIRANGKSGAWIENVPVTRAELMEFSSFLIDIHGQHEHQSLMKVSEHRKFLDARAGIEKEVQDFSKLYTELVEKRKVLEQLCSSVAERERQIEMLSFAVNEITEAKLKPEEDIKLEDEIQLALRKAKNYIAKSLKTKMQVITYLKGKGFSGKVIFEVVEIFKVFATSYDFNLNNTDEFAGISTLPPSK